MSGTTELKKSCSVSFDVGRKRLRIGIGLMLTCLAIIAGRVIIVQVVDPGGLSSAADVLRTQSSVLPAQRGKIVDSRGVVLAESVLHYDIVGSARENSASKTFSRLDPSGVKQKVSRETGIGELASVLKLPAEELNDLLAGEGQFAYLTRSVEPEVESAVMALQIPGVTSRPVEHRTYPLGPVAGSIVGYVNEDGGAAGVEQTLNEQLKGIDGSRTYQIGADGIIIPTTNNHLTPAVDGQTVKLTVDSDLQFYCQKAIASQVAAQGAEYGNIIVVEAKTGKIRAMAESRTVDPNDPGATAPQDRGARSVTAALEPGSTEKAVTAAAAIQEGMVEPLEPLVVPPTYSVKGQVFSDSFVHGTLQRTFAGVIGESLNTGTVMVGEKLSRQQRFDYLFKFGIGQKTGIPIPGETAGLLAAPETWDARQEFSVLFGQGVSQSPLQTAMVFQTLANNGVRLQPQLIESFTGSNGVVNESPQAPGAEVVSPETAQKVRDILESVVTEGGAKDVKVAGYRIGGKTGTAEAVAANGRGFDGYTASFVGMASMEDPRYVVMVNVQRPKGDIYGISQAGVFNDVMGHVLAKYEVPVSNAPAVRLPQTY